MTKRLAALFIMGLSIAAVTGCGRKGPLELPPGRAPQAVERLSAAARDGAVLLTWANPVKTVAGQPLGPLGSVEIWVFEKDLPAEGAAVAPDAVEAKARLAGRLEAAEAGAGRFLYTPAPGGTGRVAFTVRVLDRRGRASAFSPVAVAAIVRPPAAPARAEGPGP